MATAMVILSLLVGLGYRPDGGMDKTGPTALRIPETLAKNLQNMVPGKLGSNPTSIPRIVGALSAIVSSQPGFSRFPPHAIRAHSPMAARSVSGAAGIE
jgi:hypothetical protein